MADSDSSIEKASGSSIEKSSDSSIEKASHSIDGGNLYRPEVDVSGVDEKKLMRRVDLYVIPWVTVLYLFSFLDRGSIGNAKLYGLESDLGMTDTQYLLCLSLFFIPYAIFEPASNVFLRRLKPSVWLSCMMILWGTAMALHGVVKNFQGLLALRLVLGVTEAGLYPGIVYYISSWYKRSETGLRVAVSFSSATIAGAFSGLLAAAIVKMDGVGGRPGWAWIFILEGIATVIAAVASFWMIQDFPDNAKFLTETERVYVIRRLQADNKLSAAGEAFKSDSVWQSLRDKKTYAAMGFFMGVDGALYAFSLFLPTIINQLGFRATKANLLSVPVYAWGCLVTVVIGYVGDRTGRRYYINFVLSLVGLGGYLILILSRTPGLSYFAVYLAISAIFPMIPNSIAWLANNVEGTYKRSVTLGMAIGFGNINGAITANIYRAKDRPWYRLGHGLVFMYISIGFICTIIFAKLLERENESRERGERDEVIEGVINDRAHERNGTYPSVEAARLHKGDEWSGFRYTY